MSENHTKSPRLRVTPFFRWYDLWIGAYVDTKHRTLYVCPLPMLGLKIELRRELRVGCIVEWDETNEIYQLRSIDGDRAWVRRPNAPPDELDAWVPVKELRYVA